MNEFRTLCASTGRLSSADIDQIEEIKKQLPLIADLTNADVFLDVLASENKALVVGQARPTHGISSYEKNILGEYALSDKEPAVFHAFRIGLPVSDLKAITQEGQTVRQNVAPICNDEKKVIAVLIREKDISDELQQKKKYEELAKQYEENAPSVRAIRNENEQTEVALREMHHRVKNNLQLVASILNLQARKAENEETKLIFRENVSRVLSIASIHDMLVYSSGDMSEINSKALMEKLRHNLIVLIPPEKQITLDMSADEISLASDTATSVALVITELVTNAFFHAFSGRSEGCVTVSLNSGNLFHTVTVQDNGSGFDVQNRRKDSLGLSIVNATVQDKLRGRVRINSDEHGTTVSFDFKNDNVEG